jgi:hypothetical protein
MFCHRLSALHVADGSVHKAAGLFTGRNATRQRRLGNSKTPLSISKLEEHIAVLGIHTACDQENWFDCTLWTPSKLKRNGLELYGTPTLNCPEQYQASSIGRLPFRLLFCDIFIE